MSNRGSGSDKRLSLRSSVGPDVATLVQSMVNRNNELVEQNRVMIGLLTNLTSKENSHHGKPQSPLDGYDQEQCFERTAEIHQTGRDIWIAILGSRSTQSDEFMKTFHLWDRPDSIQAVLDEKKEWTSWSYAAAFPNLAKFLKDTNRFTRHRSQVFLQDYDGSGMAIVPFDYHETRTRKEVLWERIKFRSYSDDRPTSSSYSSVRLLQVVDLSPIVLTCILASAPRLDLSYMAAFAERHLGFNNWARASLLKFGDMSWSSYTFEYHFSFFYVTGDICDPASAKRDIRQLRKSAPFGIDSVGDTRYIHEESLSFLLIGHFQDVCTCVQLAESYFKFDPYAKNMEAHSFRPFNEAEPPALLLLSWIAVSLHHVSWRWQSAIDAVDTEIKSAGQIVFMEDRSDLMSDDPEFSLSKRYFWALQAYKLFEETICETIQTWKDFKENSLPKLRDSRISEEDWQMSVGDIDDAIEELEKKVQRIRKRRDEVKDLRMGLVSASALFDSRTAVRQGENIRLLTYITILFFPLSFATSIFGMQFMSSGSSSIIAFAAILPAITVATAVFVFNLETITTTWDVGTTRLTDWLRESMRVHHRDGWRVRAAALQKDALAGKAPVRKAKRLSSGWVYLYYLSEYLFLTLPVSETVTIFRHFNSHFHKGASNNMSWPNRDINETSSKDKKASTREKVLQKMLEEEDRLKQQREAERGFFVTLLHRTWKGLRRFGGIIILFLRCLLMPLWIDLLAIEFSLSIIALMISDIYHKADKRNNTDYPFSMALHDKPKPKSPAWIRAWEMLGLDELVPVKKPGDGIRGELRPFIRRAATESRTGDLSKVSDMDSSV